MTRAPFWLKGYERWENLPPTTHPMAEIKEITNMSAALHMDEQRTLVHVPCKEEMTIGRSSRADYVPR